jgi:DNA-binding Lrp family transcriptional regulator
MKLTEKEAAVIASIEVRADAPIKLLQKESGLRGHTFRYALRALIARKVLTPVPYINLHRLGLTIYSIFFTVGGEKRGAHEALIRSLVAEPKVLWVGEFGGEYQYGVGVAAKRLPDLTGFLDVISKKHGAIFHDKAVSVQISSTIFPRRYLSSRKMTTQPVTVTYDNREPVQIDSLDQQILAALTTYSELSHRQIALQIQVPLSTLELRVKKLRESGVLAADIYGVDASKFNMETFKLLVYTKGLDRDLTERLYHFCAKQPNVTTLIDCLGSWGYEINVEVQQPRQLSLIVQQLYEQFGNSIHTIRTLTKFGYWKFRFFPEMTKPHLSRSSSRSL